MKVFLSWSGESSKTLAGVLREWLALVFPDVGFWMSSRDIQAGQRWGNELDRDHGVWHSVFGPDESPCAVVAF